MTTQFTITIASTQIINGIEYTEAQLLQGLAQIRTQHNQRTGESLSDAEWLQWAHEQNLAAWYEQNKGAEPVEPSPIEPQADWEALIMHILGGTLYPMYARLTTSNFVNPLTATQQQIAEANNIAVASGKIDQAVQVTRVESAVQTAFQLLYQTSSYRFTTEEINLWNQVTSDLNFTSTIQL